MASSLPDELGPGHLLRADIGRRRMAKADLRKAEMPDFRPVIGRAVDRARTLAALSLKEFADAIRRDERQVARWINGKERPQIDAIFAVETLWCLFVIALAELKQDIEVVTEIRIRRKAS